MECCRHTKRRNGCCLRHGSLIVRWRREQDKITRWLEGQVMKTVGLSVPSSALRLRCVTLSCVSLVPQFQERCAWCTVSAPHLFICLYLGLPWVSAAACRPSLVATSRVYSVVTVCGLLTGWLLWLWSMGSRACSLSDCDAQSPHGM